MKKLAQRRSHVVIKVKQPAIVMVQIIPWFHFDSMKVAFNVYHVSRFC